MKHVDTTRNARPIAPGSLAGFGHFHRYWSASKGCHIVHIKAGEYYVTNQHELISTVLGSCISACIRDPLAGIGGMNHFMLPTYHNEGGDRGAAARFGNHAMELLINELIKNGAMRKRLEVKLFGGGSVLKQATNVGRRNIDFVHEYIATEGFWLAAEDVGGPYARKVVYSPLEGKARVQRTISQHVQKREINYMHQLEEQPQYGEIELFGEADD